jgi:hypothetical protein
VKSAVMPKTTPHEAHSTCVSVVKTVVADMVLSLRP